MDRIELGLMTLIALAGCSAPQVRTIEPGMADYVDARVASTDDSSFVLSRKRADGWQAPMREFPIHLAEKWFPFRAEYLQITEIEAHTRDASMMDVRPPDQFWDEQTAVEAVSIWSTLCNECHGGRRKIKDGLDMPHPPDTWGIGAGLFFGKRKFYTEVYNTIIGGGPMHDGKPSEMPSWRNKLSNEMIWTLIYFLEYQSGGVEGRFPPSLYPRGPDR